MQSLTAHLETVLKADREQLRLSLIPALVDCIAKIAKALRAAQEVSLVGTANAFGDDQLNVDVLAEQIIRQEVAKCKAVTTASSEEDPKEIPVRQSGSDNHDASSEQYTIAFDPLDGSSIIAPNWTVGTIIGIWNGKSALHQRPHASQIASILGVYGPRTTAIVAVRLPGQAAECFEVGISSANDGDKFEIIRTSVKLSPPPVKTRYFAPANLRAASENERYFKLVNHYIQQKYTLRYSGGLVPDIVHTLVKGHGIYVSPVTGQSKAKLRRLYELAPIALIMEASGGSAYDAETGQRILETPIEDCDERAGIICGTGEEVDFVMKSFGLPLEAHEQ